MQARQLFRKRRGQIMLRPLGRFRIDQRGATAVEFAFVAPVLIALTFGGLQYGLSLWTENSLQGTAAAAARCIAIDSSSCVATGPGPRCDSSDPDVCYVIQSASANAITLSAKDISINRAYTNQSVSYTRVSITYSPPFSLLSSPTVTATGDFPNAAG